MMMDIIHPSTHQYPLLPQTRVFTHSNCTHSVHPNHKKPVQNTDKNPFQYQLMQRDAVEGGRVGFAGCLVLLMMPREVAEEHCTHIYTLYSYDEVILRACYVVGGLWTGVGGLEVLGGGLSKIK